ncbi:MAG: hypothetical protein AAGN35_22795 [Bacteroidota bacterium]
MSNVTKNSNGVYMVPAIASAIIPGLGQLIKGHFSKAVLFFLIGVAWSIFSFIVTWIPLVGWVLGPILWLINVGDALLNANEK